MAKPKTAEQVNTPQIGKAEASSPMYIDNDGQWKLRGKLKDCTACKADLRREFCEEVEKYIRENYYPASDVEALIKDLRQFKEGK